MNLRRPQHDDEIEWRAYARIPPGEYFANCYWAKRYRDPGMKRWTCLLRWDVLSGDLLNTIARCVPLWFALGDNLTNRVRPGGESTCRNGCGPTVEHLGAGTAFLPTSSRAELPAWKSGTRKV